MSVDYTIKAFPTKYRGITYRSRLEARWAAFFDQLGWSHVYEPYDMGAWSPDFLVNGSILVEVKPITEPDNATINKIITACSERGVFANGDLAGALLVGISPIPARNYPLLHPVQIGWFIGEPGGFPNDTGVHPIQVRWCLDPNSVAPRAIADLYCQEKSGICSAIFTHWDGHTDDPSGPFSGYPEHTMGIWGNAVAEVQYRGPR